MRQAQVRGGFTALLVLLLLGGLVALVITASLAVALPVAGALLLLGLARSLWYRLTGRTPPPPFGTAAFRTIRFGPAWGPGAGPGPEQDEGPVVDALPRAPAGGASGGDAGEGPARRPDPPDRDDPAR